jgi:hypothetical protein
MHLTRTTGSRPAGTQDACSNDWCVVAQWRRGTGSPRLPWRRVHKSLIASLAPGNQGHVALRACTATAPPAPCSRSDGQARFNRRRGRRTCLPGGLRYLEYRAQRLRSDLGEVRLRQHVGQQAAMLQMVGLMPH